MEEGRCTPCEPIRIVVSLCSFSSSGVGTEKIFWSFHMDTSTRTSYVESKCSYNKYIAQSGGGKPELEVVAENLS